MAISRTWRWSRRWSMIGYRHFENIKMGIGAATLYLMLPYTAQMTGHVDHVLPAALLVWAVVFYRRPALAGIFMGLAIVGRSTIRCSCCRCGSAFTGSGGWPASCSGVGRLDRGDGAVAGLRLEGPGLVLAQVPADVRPLDSHDRRTCEGIWGSGLGSVVSPAGDRRLRRAGRRPGDLARRTRTWARCSACSAAMMVAVQFWHGYGDGGGMYMAWYPAAAADDRLPPEPGRPRRPDRAGRRLVHLQAPRPSGAARPGGVSRLGTYGGSLRRPGS